MTPLAGDGTVALVLSAKHPIKPTPVPTTSQPGAPPAYD